MKTVHQSLYRDQQRAAFAKLKDAGIAAQMLYDPSLSGKTMTVFLVQVAETDVGRANAVLGTDVKVCPKCGHPRHESKMHQGFCTFYVAALGAECGCSCTGTVASEVKA